MKNHSPRRSRGFSLLEVLIDRSWYSSMVFNAKDKLEAPEGITPLFTELTGSWSEALESGLVDVVLACRFLHTGISVGVQEALIKREEGITVAWNPEFHDFDRSFLSR